MNKLTSLKALILAAGYGTRLKKLGQNTPKGLFVNKQKLSILDLAIHQLEQISTIDELALITNQHFYDQYSHHLTVHYPHLKIPILDDGSTQPENRLGSLGDLFFAIDQLGWWNNNIIVLPSDRTPENIIPNLVHLFTQHPDTFITCVSYDSKAKIRNKSGCAVLNDQQQIVNFEEKPANPKSNYRAIPFYIFPKKSLILLKKYKQAKQNLDSPGNIIPWLLKNNFPMIAYITRKNSFDIGDLIELKNFQTKYNFSLEKK